jgi:large subunit ribosomal protein L31
MKAKIHPQYYPDCKVTCACGNTFTTGSTLPEIKVDICSACHPFFTGEMKFVDTQGRVEKFQAKMKQAGSYQNKKQKKAAKKQEEAETTPLTLREMIQAQRKQQKQTDKLEAKSEKSKSSK